MISLHNKKLPVVLAVQLSLGLIATPLVAEEVIQKEEKDKIEVIQVSATKRIESIKEVPVSVSTFGQEDIEALGVVDMRDASAFIPNFEFSNDPIIPNFYMRGLGSGISQIIEQSIGTFNDGVYIGRATVSTLGFMDIQSVEVLRGTQGTLFGKNTVAGALVFNTNNPTEHFEAGINGSIGSYSTTGQYYEMQGFVSGPLTDNLNGRIAVRYRDSDGYVENRLDGPDGVSRKDYSARVKLQWTPSDRTDVNLKLEYAEYSTDGQNGMEILGFDEASDPSRYAYFKRLSPDFESKLNFAGDLNCNSDSPYLADAEDFCPNREQDYSNITLKVEHEFDHLTFTSITGYQDYFYDDKFVSLDIGITGGAFRATRIEDYSSISQEFRITSQVGPDLPFDYIVGVYLDDVELVRDQQDHFNLALLLDNPNAPKFDRQEDWSLDTQTQAIFGQLRWHINDDWTTTFGARYSREEKDFDFIEIRDQYYTQTNGDVNDPNNISVNDISPGSRSESKFTPSFNLGWKATDDLNLYYTFATGHKTGGFSDRLSPSQGKNVEFEAETSDMNEIGIKTVLLDGTLDLNIALFHMSMSDLQVARVGTGTECGTDTSGAANFCFVVQNAAEVTSQGIEFDWRFYATENLSLGGAYAYTDATYDSFDTGACHIGTAGFCDLAGEPLIFAPEHKGNVYASYVHDTDSGWEVSSLVNVSYSSEYYGDQSLTPETLQDSFSLVNASIKFQSPDNYSISLIGRNLTEEAVLSFGIPTPGGQPYGFGGSAPPREIALSFSIDFE